MRFGFILHPVLYRCFNAATDITLIAKCLNSLSFYSKEEAAQHWTKTQSVNIVGLLFDNKNNKYIMNRNL